MNLVLIYSSYLVLIYSSYIIARHVLWRSELYGVGEVAEYSAEPEKQGEPAEELLTELDPLGDCFRRTELIASIPLQDLTRPVRGQTLQAAALVGTIYI